MTMLLHCGAEEVPYEGLRELETPEGTSTHVPIPHFRVADYVRAAVLANGHTITNETHATTKEGSRYFGLLELQSDYGDYSDTVIVRNAHDKSFPVAVGFGSKTFVCDNLAFIASHSVKRRHTKRLTLELPGHINMMIEPLASERERQHRTINRFKATPYDDMMAHHAIMLAYEADVINIQRVANVLDQWRTPDFDWGPDTAWKLMSCVTRVLEGRTAEDPRTTQRLHEVIDGTCVRLN